jgi:hypothetical protein
MAARLTPRAANRRRTAAVALVLLVAAGHGGVTAWFAAHVHGLIGPGADLRRPPPIEVSFVRELEPTAPPSTPPAPPPRRTRAPAAAVPSAPAASTPDATPPPASAPAASDEVLADVGPPASEVVLVEEGAATTEGVLADKGPAASEPDGAPAGGAADAVAADGAASSAEVAAVPAGAASATGPAFEWPPSTRLDYVLTGWYRGEVHGSAQVQWLRDGERYQVRMDVIVGPGFAPLVARRMVSDGELTADGLRPHRYDEETTVVTRPARLLTLHFDRDRVLLANGRTVPTPDGLQDPSSQFVQLTWLFTLQPHLLRPGQVVEFPLALPRRVERWRYEVVGEEVLATPFGGLNAVHVRPSREIPKPGQDLSAEAWFAPTLQYLPVRLRIRQDAENFVDLMLANRPLQAP